MTKMEIIGDNIQFYRKNKGIKQQDLAKSLGISSSQLSLMEAGKRTIYTSTLEKLCSLLKVSMADLTGVVTFKAQTQEEKLLTIFKDLTPDSKSLLLVRAKELQLLDNEKSNLFGKIA